MPQPSFSNLKAFQNLKTLSQSFKNRKTHLKNLIKDEKRLVHFSLKEKGLFYDFSKQKITSDIKKELINLAIETNAKQKFSDMMSGEIVNATENRAALHTATRDFSNESIFYKSNDVLRPIKDVNRKIEDCVNKIHQKTIQGSTGKDFTDAVVIGIGGSYLGCDFVYTALKHYQNPLINIHFLPNVDIDNFGQTIKDIDPETCLWIVISKSYTTTETMANLNQVMMYLNRHKLDPAKHIVTVTSKGSPGDDPGNPVLESFHMFDFIGGRYSVSSAVGGLPLSLAFGYEVFQKFLRGCHAMDLHALNQDEHKNIPLMSALISVWNSNFLDYNAQAIIPYSAALSQLSPHVQQLYMESLGKGVTSNGDIVDYQTGVIIFGEPGTNAQHSFFQLAHQGSTFPIEFIGIVKPVYTEEQSMSKGVYNHQELWANMIAQANALATGKNDQDKSKVFTGNRPSSTILINDISPESIGMLLSFYEARTVYEGFILGLNPFDQFGVELGKITATGLRKEIEQKNKDRNHKFNSLDPVSEYYLEILFKGSL